MSVSPEIYPIDEPQRVQALKRMEILDTPPDGSFDRLTRLAAKLLEMPIAIVTLVDTDRIWFKSKYGLDVQEISRDPGLCSSAIMMDDLYLVEDARNDLRTLANPLVASDFGLQFYAAVPIKTKDGYNLGTLCVIDKKPRKLSSGQIELLKNFADLVMDQMDLRIEARIAVKNQAQLLNITAHDLKNPLAIMPLLADMIVHNRNNPKAIEDIGLQIKDAGKRMNHIITELLETSLLNEGGLQLRLKSLDLAGVVKGVVDANKVIAKNKNQTIHFTVKENCNVFADHQRLTEILDNLINNAIKFSPFNKDIFVTVLKENSLAMVEVKDEGPGLTNDDKLNLFKRFTSLSAQPTNGENSTGLGLSIVKELVDAHNAEIVAFSEGLDKGTTFTLKFPVSQC